MNILLVDDEPIVLKSVGGFLKRAGYGVTTENSALDALKTLKNSAIDVVITDVCMDKMTGLELLDRIRFRYPEIPVVLFTAHGTLTTAIDALRKGAFDYLLKPLNLEELVQVIDRIETRLSVEKEATGSIQTEKPVT